MPTPETRNLNDVVILLKFTEYDLKPLINKIENNNLQHVTSMIERITTLSNMCLFKSLQLKDKELQNQLIDINASLKNINFNFKLRISSKDDEELNPKGMVYDLKDY